MGRNKKEDKQEAKPVPSNIDDSFNDPELDLVVSSIEKDFGKGALMTMGVFSDKSPEVHISTGSIALDVALGKGGFVFGRAIEIYGPEGAGKSTLCIELMARAQKHGLTCAYIDKEQALDIDYCKALGVDISKLWIAQPNSGEETLDIINRLTKSGKFDVIVLDSIAAINPEADLDKSLSDGAKMAGRAKILTEFFNKTLNLIQKNKVLFVCTNQLRDGLNPYGPKEVTSGGRALKYAVSQRIEIRPKEKLTDSNGEIIGNTVRIKTVKNRLNVPYKEIFVDIIFGKGFDKLKDLIDVSIGLGIVKKGGAWLSFDRDGKEEKLQGIEKLKEAMESDPSLYGYLKSKVEDAVGINRDFERKKDGTNKG